MPQVECPDVPSHTSVLTVTCHNFGHQHKPTALDPRGGRNDFGRWFFTPATSTQKHGRSSGQHTACLLPVPALISATCLSHTEMEPGGYVAVLLFSSPLTVDYLYECSWFSLTNLFFFYSFPALIFSLFQLKNWGIFYQIMSHGLR